MNDKMKNLAVRTMSGAVLTVVVLGAILWSQWSFGALLLVLLLTGMYEFYALAEKQGDAPQRIVGMVAGTILFLLNFAIVSDALRSWGPDRAILSCAVYVLVSLPAMFILELFRKSSRPAANIGTTMAAIAYVAMPLSLMCYFPLLGTNGWDSRMVIFFIFIIWANDVFAYLVGMSIGRHKLFERLSPKKSWEGFFGGLLGAVAMGFVAAYVLDASRAMWVGLALIAAVTGVLGDLAESMLKRAAGVKDSGSLIPGHGGVLDRFDAMLLAAPFVFVYLLLFHL